MFHIRMIVFEVIQSQRWLFQIVDENLVDVKPLRCFPKKANACNLFHFNQFCNPRNCKNWDERNVFEEKSYSDKIPLI